MHTKNVLALFVLTTAVVAAPVPSNPASDIMGLFGSAVGSLNANGQGNTAGTGNDKNGNENGNGSGSNNGNGNTFGNKNAIGSGNSGLSIGKRGGISDLFGSALGSLNGNGAGNAAGNANKGNGVGNGNGSGSNNGNNNDFGNENEIGSGNSGLSIGKKVRQENAAPTAPIFSRSPSLSSYVNGVWVAAIDPVASQLSSSGDIATTVGSATNSLSGNGNGNTAGSNNAGNGVNNGNGAGSNNGNGNTFGNDNDILSNNGGINVRRQLPAGALSPVPDQTLTSLNKVGSQLLTVVVPSTGPEVLAGALSGEEQDFGHKEKRQLVFTGVGSAIAQTVGPLIPRED